MIKEPDFIHLPDLKYPREAKKAIKEMDLPVSLWAEEDTEYAVRQQVVADAERADAQALKEAALAGEPNPGTDGIAQPTRALRYQEQRLKAAIAVVNRAIGLQVKDLDMLRRRISVARNAVEVGGVIVVGTPKSHNRRSVPFPEFLAPLLAQQCEGKFRDGLVFADKYGRHVKRTRVSDGSRSWFLTALSTAGLPKMTFHDLRHTAASLAVSVGANVKAVQRMLGHASAAMTLDTYADLFDDDLNAVADRLNDAATFSSVVKRLSKPNPRV
jgi:integrase